MNPKSRTETHLPHETDSALAARQVRGEEFASPESLLREDRSQVDLPPGILNRLGASLTGDAGDDAPGSKPWWKRLIG